MDAPNASDGGSSGNAGEQPDRGAPPAISVRRIAPDEGELLRTTRLAAIADRPGEYATTLAEAEARPMVQWERVAEASSAGGDQGTWFAEAGSAVVGMVSAYWTSDDVITMRSLWSAPGFRDVGVADSLVSEVTAWGIMAGGLQLRIWVVQRNEHARRFYDRLGFEATGEEMQYEPDPRLVECEMRKSLA